MAKDNGAGKKLADLEGVTLFPGGASTARKAQAPAISFAMPARAIELANKPGGGGPTDGNGRGNGHGGNGNGGGNGGPQAESVYMPNVIERDIVLPVIIAFIGGAVAGGLLVAIWQSQGKR